MNKSKQKGTAFETAAVRYLREQLGSEHIMRQPLAGSKDLGDIAGVECGAGKVVIECKAYASQPKLAQWLREAETERNNAGAAVGVIVAKRRGVGDKNIGKQLVAMTLDNFIKLLKGENNER